MSDTVYIAGPMRGYPEFNFPTFDRAEKLLLEQGYEVWSPARHDRERGFDPTGLTGFENLNEIGFDLRRALYADTGVITNEADAICLLPGWENSPGVRAELALAAAIGLWAGELADFEAGCGAPYLAGEYLNRPAVSLPALGGRKAVKPERYNLIPGDVLAEVARLYGQGATKYAERNWEAGYAQSLSFDALNRHLWAYWQDREDYDPESNCHHLAAVIFHAAAMMRGSWVHPQFDDRPPSGGRRNG